MLEQPEGWQPHKDIPSLQAFVNSLAGQAPIQPPVGAQESIDIDQFALVMKQLDYDVKVFETWQRKCSNVGAARFHAQQSWKLSQYQRCQGAAQLFCSQFVRLLQWDRKVEQAITSTIAFRKQAQQRIAAGNDDIPILAVANMSSLSEIPATTYSHMSAYLSWMLADNANNTGLVLYPAYTYNRGKLHVDEQRVTTSLAISGANIDHTFSLLFTDQVDGRDLRPMVYGGRLAMPGHIDPSKTIWWGCDLRRTRRTSEVPLRQERGQPVRRLPLGRGWGAVRAACTQVAYGPVNVLISQFVNLLIVFGPFLRRFCGSGRSGGHGRVLVRSIPAPFPRFSVSERSGGHG